MTPGDSGEASQLTFVARQPILDEARQVFGYGALLGQDNLSRRLLDAVIMRERGGMRRRKLRRVPASRDWMWRGGALGSDALGTSVDSERRLRADPLKRERTNARLKGVASTLTAPSSGLASGLVPNLQPIPTRAGAGASPVEADSGGPISSRSSQEGLESPRADEPDGRRCRSACRSNT